MVVPNVLFWLLHYDEEIGQQITVSFLSYLFSVKPGFIQKMSKLAPQTDDLLSRVEANLDHLLIYAH